MTDKELILHIHNLINSHLSPQIDPLDSKIIKRIMRISDNYLLAYYDPIPEIINYIDSETDNLYSKYLNDFHEAEKSGLKPNWNQKKQAQKWWDEYASFLATEISNDILNTGHIYVNGKQATKVDLIPVCIGDASTPTRPKIDYLYAIFIKSPDPIKDTIDLEILSETEISYYPKVSSAIKLNQVGFLPESKKYAYIACHMYNLGSLIPTTMEAKITSGSATYIFPLTLRSNEETWELNKNDPPETTKPLITGEKVYELDFSVLTIPGSYTIEIEGIGSSHPFKVGPVYDEVNYYLTRKMFESRHGLEMKPPYSNWPRPDAVNKPIYKSDNIFFLQGITHNKPYERFDVIAATIDPATQIDEHAGGWFDAADWDRNMSHSACALSFLNSFELWPDKFRPGQYHFDKSNHIPDILNEVIHGLDIWIKTMTDEGGVCGQIEAHTHTPAITDVPYTYGMATRWNTLLFCQQVAQLSRLLKPIDENLHAKYKQLALKTYAWGMDPENAINKTINAISKRGAGEPYTYTFNEIESDLYPYMLGASIQMHRLTNDLKYLEQINLYVDNVKGPNNWPFDIKDFSTWFYFDLLRFNYLDESKRSLLIKKWFVDRFEEYATSNMPYRHSWRKSQDFWFSWGAHTMTNQAKMCTILYLLTNDIKYRDAAIFNFDYQLGANALGLSWITGLGTNYPLTLQDETSELDSIIDPRPGIQLYAITGGFNGEIAKAMNLDSTKIPTLKKIAFHQTLNTAQMEYTIHETISSALFVSAFLMDGNHTPSKLIEPKEFDEKITYYIP